MGNELDRREVPQGAEVARLKVGCTARAARASKRPHLMPLNFVLGAALPEDRLTPVFEGFHHGTLSTRSFALRG